MPDVIVDADMKVRDGAVTRDLDTLDFTTTRTGAGTEATLAAVRDRLTGMATEVTLAALRTAVSTAEAARDSDATAAQARLDVLASEATLAQVRDKDFATQATLEALRAAFVAEDFATQATLASVLAQLQAAETARDADATTDQGLLATLRDTIVRRTDTLKTTPASLDLVEAGLTYFSGGEAVTSVTTPNASITLENPAASGRNLYAHGWSVYADAAATIRYFRGGTNSAAATTNHVNGIVGGGLAPVGVVRVGAGVYTPGTELAPKARVNTQAPILERGRYMKIVPGELVTIRFIGPGATNIVNFSVEWSERVI